MNENLLRIARERANADRKLKPKKEHTGYVVVVSSEKIYRYKSGRYLESVKLWETVIQSPYSIEFPAKQAKKLILEEFFPETGEWEAARLGIERWVAGDYEDFLSAADKDEEFMQQNTALTGYRSFRANYRAGYWENDISSYKDPWSCPEGYASELKEAKMMKMGLCAEDAVTHNLTVVWTGLDTKELKEGEQLEIRVAGHWIEVELERDPDGGWSWRDLETGWSLKRTDVAPVSVPEKLTPKISLSEGLESAAWTGYNNNKK